jgi:hypothetical protein
MNRIETKLPEGQRQADRRRPIWLLPALLTLVPGDRTTGVFAIVLLLLVPAGAAADVVLDWNAVLLATAGGQNPFAQGRVAAITHLAVFEAVNAVTGEYTPYLGTLGRWPDASAEAAAVAAAHRVLTNYFPGSAPGLDAARAASLATIPDGNAKAQGIALGEAAGAAMIALRANDGSAPPQFHLPSSADPGEWQLTRSCPPAGGVFLHWRNVTPFGIQSSDQFRSDPPPALSSAKYANDYREVMEVGALDSSVRPTDRADVARFYAVVSAVGAWNPALSQAIGARALPLSATARAFALLNMAISDGLVAVMDTKYHYNFWRPETAIPRGAEDNNARTTPDPGFAPFVTTPCFPSYPSGHAAASYAARSIAERLLGEDGHAIVLFTPAVPNVTLHYSSFEAITTDIDDARVYGGIHFRFDQRVGARQGRAIGAYIYQTALLPSR